MMLFELVTRARRRFLWNEILSQSAYAVSVALAALILLLLLGTQILDWRWLLLLPLSAFLIGVYRTVRRLPSPYGVAQLVDQRLALVDTLSTAIYFHEAPREAIGSESVRAAQLEQAERLSATVVAAQAIPFTMPRAVYSMGLLALVASSLFALRYGLDRRLDLKPPLAQIIQQAFGIGEVQQAALPKKGQAQKRNDLQDALGISVQDSEQKGPGELEAAPDSALDTVGVPEVDNSQNAAGQGNAKSKSPDGDKISGDQEGEAAEDAQSGNNGENSQEGSQGPKQGQQSGQKSAANQSPGSAGDKSSLLSKFRDAMSNLLSRMKQQQNGAGAQQQSAMGQSNKQGKGQQANGGQKGRQGQQSGGQEADSQDSQSSEDAENAQNAQSRGAGQSADQQSSKQPGSGIGRQDGNKDVKLAEQLAAMGKISEIIGKRSANLTGEITVEVQNSNQQLRTPYSQSAAEHTASGGEISRDEVPVALQAYVRQYFEQIRKQAAPAQNPPAAAGAQGSGSKPPN